MNHYSYNDVERLIGLDRVPKKGSVPAVWWITTDAAQLVNFDLWRADYAAHIEKVEKLAQTIGLTADAARVWAFGDKSEIAGFDAPADMYLVPSHPRHIPVPEGWRLNRKTDRLVPSRKTKAERESQANVDFAAIRKVPCVRAYLSGLPTEIYLQDRDAGAGTMYGVNYWRGARCVAAYCGGDPDRCEAKNKPTINENIWHRQRLSALVELMERAEELQAAS